MSPIDILPAVRAAQHVVGGFELHVLALVIAPVEDHLVGTGAAFEAVFAGVVGVGGGEFGGVEGGYGEHVAAGWADWRGGC